MTGLSGKKQKWFSLRDSSLAPMGPGEMYVVSSWKELREQKKGDSDPGIIPSQRRNRKKKLPRDSLGIPS